MKKILFYIVIWFSVSSCEKEKVIAPDINSYTSIITPERRQIDIFKVENSSEVPNYLLPKIFIPVGSIANDTRLLTTYYNINTLSLPDEFVSISSENYIWNFDFLKHLKDSVLVTLPYSNQLESKLLTKYKHRFVIYSCNDKFEDWKVENIVSNDTVSNTITFNYLNDSRFYGVFFDEVRFPEGLTLDVSITYPEPIGDSAYHHFVSSTNYFKTLPVSFLDKKIKGLYELDNRVYYHAWGISYDYFRVMLDFKFDGERVYNSDEFNFKYDANLWITGSWQNNFVQNTTTKLEVIKWGDIGQEIILKVYGGLDYTLHSEFTNYNTDIDLYIQTIRCR